MNRTSHRNRANFDGIFRSVVTTYPLRDNTSRRTPIPMDKLPSHRQKEDLFASGEFGFGDSTEFGLRSDVTIDTADREVDVVEFLGGAGGLTCSKSKSAPYRQVRI